MFRRLQPFDILAMRRVLSSDLPNEAQPREWCLNGTPGWGQTVASLTGTWFPLGRRRQAWVVAPEGRMLGMVAVRPRSGPSAWEIERLVAADPEDLGPEILEHLLMAAASAGAERLFVRLPVDSPWCEVAQRSGFSTFMQEQLYLSSVAGWSPPPSLPLRPRHARDDMALFRLYCLAVPAAVRQALGVTFQEWRDSREALPSRRGLEAVYEEESALLGWLRLTTWGRAKEFAVMSHPLKGDQEGLVRHALASCPPRTTVSCLVPDYQGGLARLLEEFGFGGSARYVSLVRMVAVRSSHPCLLPAQA